MKTNSDKPRISASKNITNKLKANEPITGQDVAELLREHQELREAAENAVYWMLRAHASDVEEGICDMSAKPGYLLRLQSALMQAIPRPP